MPIKRCDGKELDLKDTQKLQMASLEAFAMCLGFIWDGRCFWNGVRKTAYNSVSLETMQMWHNMIVVGKRYLTVSIEHSVLSRVVSELSSMLKLPSSQVYSAMNSRLVKHTKLQFSKKAGIVLCTDHQIEFV